VGYVVAADGAARVSFAAPGDVDLNGSVNVFDLVAINGSGSFGTGHTAVWSDGDFTYDGVTDVFDLVAIGGSGAYGGSEYFPSSVGSAAVATVPEPFLATSVFALGMLAQGIAVLKKRRLPGPCHQKNSGL